MPAQPLPYQWNIDLRVQPAGLAQLSNFNMPTIFVPRQDLLRQFFNGPNYVYAEQEREDFWLNNFPPRVRQLPATAVIFGLTEQAMDQEDEYLPVPADRVVVAMRRQGFTPGTFDDLLMLAGTNKLTPNPAIPGLTGDGLSIHALGSCESWQKDDFGTPLTEYRYPTLHFGIGGLLLPDRFYLLVSGSSGDGEDDGYGVLRYGQDFFLAVR